MERPSSPNVLGAAMTEAFVKVVALIYPQHFFLVRYVETGGIGINVQLIY